MEAYCVKCKEKREMGSPEPTFTSSGTPATRGKCLVCDTGLYRMGNTPAHEGLEKPVFCESVGGSCTRSIALSAIGRCGE